MQTWPHESSQCPVTNKQTISPQSTCLLATVSCTGPQTVKAVTDTTSLTMTTPYSQLSSEVQTALTSLASEDTAYQPQTAHELLRLDQAVQLFFLSTSGQVSTFSAPETLRILQFAAPEEGSSQVFLQVGGWTQPLVPGATPSLQAENGAIMFPDIYSDQPGSSVGLVLVEGLVTEEDKRRLLELLEQHTALRKDEQRPEQQLGGLGGALVWGAERLAGGIELGAEKAGELIEYVTEKAEKKLSKSEEDARVSSLTKHSVNAVVTATDATVKVSGYVADRVGKLTKRMATYLASKVVDPNATGGVKKAGGMAALVDVARGGLVAYGTVYNGLEGSAKVLGHHVKNNSVKVVEHKYGGEAGNVFGDACTAAGNAAMTYMNVQSLGAKGLVKKTAKDTGKNIAKNIIGKSSGGQPAVQEVPK